MRRSTRASLSQAVALVLVLLLGALVAASAAVRRAARETRPVAFFLWAGSVSAPLREPGNVFRVEPA